MVRRRADNHVAGSRVASTGSSLYSRPITSHRSMPARSISAGEHVEQPLAQPRVADGGLLPQRQRNGPRRVGRGQGHDVSEAEAGPACPP